MMMVLYMWATKYLPAKFTCCKYIHLCNYDVTTYCKYILIIFNDVTDQLEFIFVCLQNVNKTVTILFSRTTRSLAQLQWVLILILIPGLKLHWFDPQFISHLFIDL